MSNNSPPKSNKKIIDELDFRPHNISTITEPYLLDEGDPGLPKKTKTHKGNSIKYLTSWHERLILERAKRLTRKDDKMANGSNKKTNYIQHACLAILAIAAINGIATFLGGSLKDCLVAAVLVALLYAKALDFTK